MQIFAVPLNVFDNVHGLCIVASMNSETTMPNTRRPSTQTRALMLFFRLNADAMNYTPLSRRGLRAARLMPLIRAKHLGGSAA